MDSYTSMKEKLAPLGLYRLDGNSEVDTELKAYASGLDPLFEELAVMEREAFIETAQSYGLTQRESFVGKTREDLSYEQRREDLINLEKLLGCGGTVEDFDKFLNSLGLEKIEFDERPKKRRLDVYVSDDISSGQVKLEAERILKMLPAHLNCMVSFHDGSEYTNVNS